MFIIKAVGLDDREAANRDVDGRARRNRPKLFMGRVGMVLPGVGFGLLFAKIIFGFLASFSAPFFALHRSAADLNAGGFWRQGGNLAFSCWLALRPHWLWALWPLAAFWPRAAGGEASYFGCWFQDFSIPPLF